MQDGKSRFISPTNEPEEANAFSLENDGFANDMKMYKANPAEYKGHYGDVSSIIRIALTTKTNTPDLFEIVSLLGKDEVIKRLNKVCELLK